MENQEMYKLGFELALKQAGVNPRMASRVAQKMRTAPIEPNFWEKNFPTFRQWFGFNQGTAKSFSPQTHARILQAHAPVARGAGVVRARPAVGGKPFAPAGFGPQPEGEFSVFKNRARATA